MKTRKNYKAVFLALGFVMSMLLLMPLAGARTNNCREDQVALRVQ
jgi:hypothetical protein